MTRIPAKRSRDIQRRHVRRVMTRDGPKDVLVNPGVRKPAVPPVRPGFKSVPVDRDSKANVVASNPLVRFKPRDRNLGLRISDPGVLYDLLEEDDDFYRSAGLGKYNRNVGELMELLYSVFDQVRRNRGFSSDADALEYFKDNFEDLIDIDMTVWESRLFVTPVGRFTVDTAHKDLESILYATEVNYFRDPFESEVFNDEGEDYEYWQFVRLNIGGAPLDALFDGADPKIERVDHELVSSLFNQNIPFNHAMVMFPYRNLHMDTDFLLIPRKSLKRALPILEAFYDAKLGLDSNNFII